MIFIQFEIILHIVFIEVIIRILIINNLYHTTAKNLIKNLSRICSSLPNSYLINLCIE